MITVRKYNPYHDARGRFSNRHGAAAYSLPRAGGTGVKNPDPPAGVRVFSGAKGNRVKQTAIGGEAATTDTRNGSNAENKPEAKSDNKKIPDRNTVTLNNPEELGGVKRGEPMDFDEANQGRCNPKYGQPGYRENCQCAVVAYEARRRGYDVESIKYEPYTAADLIAQQTEKAWRNPRNGKPINQGRRLNDMNSSEDFYNHAEKTIQPGERYHFSLAWKSENSAHIVAMEKSKDNKLRIYDPQSGIILNSKKSILEYSDKIDFQDPLSKMYRVDNLDFYPGVAKHILIPSSASKDK